MELSTSVELRVPVNPADKTGEYLALPPSGDAPVKGGRGGYFRAATDGAPVVWLGRTDYGDTPGRGVLSERAFADIATHYWLGELRAEPEGQWDPEEALTRARPVIRQLLGWVLRMAPGARISDGRILSPEPLPTPTYARPPASVNLGGQVSGWLANADGGDHIRARTHRLYVRRDALVRYLTGGPWPDGAWKRVHPNAAAKALERGEAGWTGLVEAQPPTGVGLLHGADHKGRARRFWSAAEILAWGADGWKVHGAWTPEGQCDAPMRAMPSPTAPLLSLAVLARFQDLVTGNPNQQFTLTMAWLTSRARAPIAPAAKAIHGWLSDVGAGLGRIYGQHSGAVYVTVPDEMFADIFDAGLSAMPDGQNWLAPPGAAWRRAEEANSEASRLGRNAREQIGVALDAGALPAEAWLDLLSFGSTEQILRADAQARARFLPPAFAAPAAAMPAEAAAAPPAGGALNPPPPPPAPAEAAAALRMDPASQGDAPAAGGGAFASDPPPSRPPAQEGGGGAL